MNCLHAPGPEHWGLHTELEATQGMERESSQPPAVTPTERCSELGCPQCDPTSNMLSTNRNTEDHAKMVRAPTCPRRRAQDSTPSLPLCLPERGISPSLTRPSQSRNHQPLPSGPAAHSAAASPPAQGGGGCGPATGSVPSADRRGRAEGGGGWKSAMQGMEATHCLSPCSAAAAAPVRRFLLPRPLPASRRARGRGGHDFIFSPLSEMSTFAAAGVSAGST